MTTTFAEASITRRITSTLHTVLGKPTAIQHRDNRHFEARQKLDDVAASITSENPIFMLKRNGVESCAVQEFGSLDIITDPFVVKISKRTAGG